jgi:ornithine cyclodeaminase/alanine dehydrogenase-like protein (mu-crystallin family)
MHIPTEGGGFHVKAGLLPIGPGYAAFKVNGNFPNNPATHGLPTIQGAILLFDASRGSPVALLDSIEITAQRELQAHVSASTRSSQARSSQGGLS